MDLGETAFYELSIPQGQRAGCLLAPHDIVLSFAGGVTIEVGRFSLGAVFRVRILSQAPQCLLRIGAFCEVANGAQILIGGEHRNESLLNYTFGAAGLAFRTFMSPEALALASPKPPSPVEIGDNVVISAGATVLDGSSIGTGCVIGASALVAVPCLPYGIYAGIPARHLRDRFSAEMARIHQATRLPEVMAHHMPAIPTLLHRLEAGEISLEQYFGVVTFLPPDRPVVYLQAALGADNNVQINPIPTGYQLGEKPIHTAEAERLDAYFAQANGSDPVRWTADIFHTIGLY